MNVVIYARYSSHSQRDESIEQQLIACRKYAADNDMRIIHEYCDHAISGTSDKRPQFIKMIADSSKKHFEKVLVYKIDRFARNRYDSATYKVKLRKNGVKVISVMEPIPEGPEGILLESVLEGSAEYYSANLSQNVMRGMSDNAEKLKVNGKPPIGYRRSADGCYELDPINAPLVREIFDMYSQGYKKTEIVKHLKAKGLTTSDGKELSYPTLFGILNNERYAGTYIWGNIRIEGGMPAIVTKEEFEAVQRMKRKRAQSPSSARSEVDFLLTGKLFCGRCGSAMSGDSGTSATGKRFYYYTCHKKKYGNKCKKKSLRKDSIENQVVEMARQVCMSDASIKLIVDTAMERQEQSQQNELMTSLELQMAEVKKAIKNMMYAIEQGIITASTKERLEELEARKEELEIEIANASIEVPTLSREQMTFFLERFKNCRPEHPSFEKMKEMFIDIFIKAVYVYDDHLRVICRIADHDEDITIEDIEEAEAGGTVDVFDCCSLRLTKIDEVEHTKFYILLNHLVLASKVKK